MKGFGSTESKALFEKGIADVARITRAPGSEETRGGKIIHLVHALLLDLLELLFTDNGQWRKVGKLNFSFWFKLGKMLLWYIKEIVLAVTNRSDEVHYNDEDKDDEDDKDDEMINELVLG